MRLSRRELSTLRRWLAASAQGRLQLPVPTPGMLLMPSRERRETARSRFETTAELRPISAGGIGLLGPATVCDVSTDGVALRSERAFEPGQQLSIAISPPNELPRRRFARQEQPIHLLAIVRYCRADGTSFVIGCSIGVEWSATLANLMFPADLPVLRRTA